MLNPTNNAVDSGDQAGLDLNYIAHVLWKHKWVMLATVAIVVTGTVLYTSRLPKRYRAKASIIIDPKAPDIYGSEVQEVVQLGGGGFFVNQEYYNTQQIVLQSREMSKRTVREHELHKNPKLVSAAEAEGKSEDEQISMAADKIRSMMTIVPPRNNRIMKVVIESHDPELAALLANLHIETYIRYHLNLRQVGTGDASRYLSDELDTAKKALHSAEERLIDFKKDQDLLTLSLEDKQSLVGTNILRATDAVANARTEKIELEALRERVLAASKKDVLESPIFDLVNNTTASVIKGNLQNETQSLIELQEKFGPKHPDVVAQRKKIAKIRETLEREATLVVNTIEERYRIVAKKMADHQRLLDKYKAEAFELGPKQVQYNPLVRQVSDAQETYGIVLNRFRATQLTGRLKTVNIRPLDAALTPTSPSYPSMRRNLAMAFGLALILGVALAFGLEFLDRTVKTVEDVEQAVKAPVLGVIPIVDVDGQGPEAARERDMHVANDPKSRVAECCRSIRTNLMFMGADHAFQTLVITSPNPREGKTTTSLYMGTAMAQSGQRVLLIDSDMRRPRLHHALGVGRNVGLSNVIVGDVELVDAIKTTDIPNLSVMPCGPTPPNPAELLMTARFSEILTELQGHYDRILLDSPPVLAVTDAVVLSHRTDGVVLVMKAGGTPRDDASRARRAIVDVNGRVLGVILNELDLENRRYGYYYKYYAYNYNYGSAGEAEARSSG